MSDKKQQDRTDERTSQADLLAEAAEKRKRFEQKKAAQEADAKAKAESIAKERQLLVGVIRQLLATIEA